MYQNQMIIAILSLFLTIKPNISLGCIVATESYASSYMAVNIGFGMSIKRFNFGCYYARYEKNTPQNLHNGFMLKAGIVFGKPQK